MPTVFFGGAMDVRIEEAPIPAELPGHVLVEIAYVGICGTDAELLRGSSPYIRRGLTTYPFVPGHEWSGVVVAAGEGVSSVAVGDRVVGDPFITCGACRMCRESRRNLCLHRYEMGVRGNYQGAAATYARAPAANVTRIADSIDLRLAPMIEPSVTVMHALRRARVNPGDKVAVIGSGTLGLMGMQIARAMGAARVDVLGIDHAGLSLALELGATATLQTADAESDAYSVVLEASGAASALALAIEIAEPGARIGIVGIPSDATTLDTAGAVVKNLEVQATLGGVDDYRRTAELFAGDTVSAAELVDRVVPAASAAEAYEALVVDRRSRPKLLIEFGGDQVGKGLTE